LEEAAFLDELTRLANGRYLKKVVEQRLAEAHRHEQDFGVIMIDIDKFRNLNTRYGRATGDKVLRMVAGTLEHACRPYDVAGRWGGDEFLVIAPHAGPLNTEALAQRLRALVEQSWLRVRRGMVSVTISAGVTAGRPDDTPDRLLRRATAALHESKTAGRNRVAFEA